MTRTQDIWSLDIRDMTQVELEEYKKELLRREERDQKRRMRNIRLIIYAVVLFLIITGAAMIPGTLRAQRGPVTLSQMGEGFRVGELAKGPDGYYGGCIKRLSGHSFQLWFEADLYEDGYRKITGEICQEPEWMNRQRKSSVSYSDGTRGAVWYRRATGDSSYYYLVVEYKGKVYEYNWGFQKTSDEEQD